MEQVFSWKIVYWSGKNYEFDFFFLKILVFKISRTKFHLLVKSGVRCLVENLDKRWNQGLFPELILKGGKMKKIQLVLGARFHFLSKTTHFCRKKKLTKNLFTRGRAATPLNTPLGWNKYRSMRGWCRNYFFGKRGERRGNFCSNFKSVIYLQDRYL